MNKTITIYELLGLVKDGKALKKILSHGLEYEFDIETKTYIHRITECAFYDLMDEYDDDLDEFLNDTVEIIEDNNKTDEEAKPITKESVEALGYACGEIQKCFTSGWTKALENKPLKGNDKLEKIKWDEKESRAGILRTAQEIEVLARRTETLKKKITELVDHINKIEEKLDER